MNPWIAHNADTIRRERRATILGNITNAMLILVLTALAFSAPAIVSKAMLNADEIRGMEPPN